MTTSVSTTPNVRDEQDYHAYLKRIQSRFDAVATGSILFATDAADLFDVFLNALSTEDRQHYTCSACRRFVNKFGGVVVINADGSAQSPLWLIEDAPEELRPAIEEIAQVVALARVTGVFLCSEPVWGTPVTGEWHHMAVTPPKSLVFKKTTQTAFQASAENLEDFKTVMTALSEFTPAQIQQAIVLLESESLYRSEKCLGVAKWLKRMHEIRDMKNQTVRHRLLWLEIAKAPAGFCHPRASMIGTLLEDIAAGMDFGDVSRRFASKMHPLQYQRPQAAPSAGNIAQAEKIISQLQASGSLARRFARLDEIQTVWRPAVEAEKPQAGGVFGHLLPKEAAVPEMSIPPITMTWDKFSRTVLPNAKRIEFRVPSRGNFSALVTAANPDAPPIIQWDREDQRNPFSGYVYHNGSTAVHWGLVAHSWCKVNAVSLSPSMWSIGTFDHQGQSVMFVLDGAKDSAYKVSGLALFPEILKSEFHGIRSTIEEFSRRGEISGTEEASANGYMLSKGDRGNWNAVIRVLADGSWMPYNLDRWD